VIGLAVGLAQLRAQARASVVMRCSRLVSISPSEYRAPVVGDIQRVHVQRVERFPAVLEFGSGRRRKRRGSAPSPKGSLVWLICRCPALPLPL